MKPIKIAYNWIGPQGPILNTEVPNILALACVTEQVNTTSRNFFAEGLWHSLFKDSPDAQLSPAWALDNNALFIYPLTLNCRISFNTYFQIDNGILEYAHVPNHILHHVRCSGGYFLIEHSAEAWVEDEYLSALHSYFNYIKVPLNKVIYVTGCMNTEVVYESYCQRNNVPNSPECRLNLVSFPISQHSIAVQLAIKAQDNVADIVYDPNLLPSKIFLSWNRRFRPHRSLLAVAMHKDGLLPKSYLSTLALDPDQGRYSFRDSFPWGTESIFNLTSEDVNNFIEILPLDIDGATDINVLCGDENGTTDRFYADSLLSIITETNFESPILTLTEKSFKQFKQKHPFILVSPAGSLRAMHALGFQTFSEFWSEEYDSITDANMRLVEIRRVCNEIALWDSAKIIDFKHRVKNIIDHNYQQVRISAGVVAAQNIVNIVRKNTP